MDNIIIVSVIIAILFVAAFGIYRSKKAGKKCIGCPHSCSCSGNCNSSKKNSTENVYR